MGRSTSLRIDIIADGKGVSKGVDEATGGLGRLGKVGAGVGLAVAAGVAAAGVAVVSFAGKAIGAASDLQQSAGAVETVFGKSAGAVKSWSDQAATSVGLAKSEYNNLAALIGAQLQGMGVAQDKSAGKTSDLIKLGSDLAATYGGSVQDAVEALSSTLKGETDPIERYGVSIKQSDVNARLAQMGLSGLSGQAAKTAQAQAVLALVTEQTAKAHGAFGRESDTLAHKQQVLGAQFENVKAKIGGALLPAATALTGWASTFLVKAEPVIAQLRDRLAPVVQAVGKFIRERLVPAAQEMLAWFRDKIAPGIARYVTPIFVGLRNAFQHIVDKLREHGPELAKLRDGFKTVAEFIATKVMPIVGTALGHAFSIMGGAIGVAIDVVSGLVDAFTNVVNAVKSVIDWIGRIHIPSAISNAIGQLGNLNPFSAAVTVGGVPLSAGVGSLDRRAGIATASFGGSMLGAILGRSSAPGGAVYIDQRNLSTSVVVQADPLGLADESAIARRLQRMLDDNQRRVGAVPSFGGVR